MKCLLNVATVISVLYFAIAAYGSYLDRHYFNIFADVMVIIMIISIVRDIKKNRP